MITALCVCRKNSTFVPYLTYRNETVFSAYEGTVIARCTHCGILKTFPAKTNSAFDPRQSRAAFYEDNTGRFEQIFKPIVETVKKYKPHGTVLDIGCSSGILLSLFKKGGYAVKGIEPNKTACTMAQEKLGQVIFNGTLGDFMRTNKARFDVVIYNHVLEHIQDPVTELSLVQRIVKPGGIVVIGVPNARNFVRFVRGKKWELLMPNEHIWQFDDKKLAGLIARFGFEVREIKFDDDYRLEYPLIKQLYFRILIGVNKLFRTGEVLLLVAQKSK